MGLRTLNVHVPWTEILAAVDIPVATHALPARVTCPLCGGARLTIYEDNISGGAWHYCFDCGKSGDMIELAAAVWDVPTAVAVRRLAAEGIPLPADRVDPANINKYVVAHPEYRARVTELWHKAKETLPRTASPTVRALREKFRLSSPMPLSRWDGGPGNMVGAVHRLVVEETFCPKSVSNGRCQTSVRAFKGLGWGDVLTVPHYDLPGRICGFLFVGRTGKSEDFVYRVPNMDYRGGHARTPSEGGLACYWAVANSQGMFGDHVVACGDPFLALRLQVRHYAAAKIPLPLVAYRDGPGTRTAAAWQSLETKVPVLWGWKLTPGLLFQAITARGKIAVTKLDDATQARIDHFVRDNEPRDIIRGLIKKARPWREFLTRWADGATDGEVEALLMGMETYGVDLVPLAELSPRIKALARIRERPREIHVGRRILTEVDGQWWETKEAYGAGRSRPKTPVLVMNATLRIDGTCVQKSSDSDREVVQYKGRLIHEGDEIPFAFSIDTMNNRGPLFLANLLARTKPKAKPLYIASGWCRRLMQAALLFSGV